MEGAKIRRIFSAAVMAALLLIILAFPGNQAGGASAVAASYPRLVIDHDQDNDGLKDLADLLQGARLDAARMTAYRNAYYRGGYPPEGEGVCTDVIWFAFKNAGYVLKSLVDRDIRLHTSAYPRVNGHPDPNIDFRRVANLLVFFRRNAISLTTALIPEDQANLGQWQGGDLVVYGKPIEHIGIVSDRRRADGVPLIVHNCSPYTKEEDYLLAWSENISPIVGHFRWPKGYGSHHE